MTFTNPASAHVLAEPVAPRDIDFRARLGAGGDFAAF